MPPLRRRTDDDDSHDAPEAMLISAYLAEGRFTPSKDSVEPDDIVAWKGLWDFCLDYQDKEGVAPPISLVHRMFPDFEVIPDMKRKWASQQVIKASNIRMMRGSMHTALKFLGDSDLEGAYSSMEKVKRPRGFRKDPADVFDHATIAERFHVTRLPVPYKSLMEASQGGIAPAELWVLAARLGQGKSWEVTGYASEAAKAGAKVCICSLEMPAAQVSYRILRRMAGADRVLRGMLLSDVETDRKEAADIIAGRTEGSISVYDPSHGRINTASSVHDLCEEYDLVVVDHVGLMQDGQGRRAVDDWRVMASISNVMREITLETQTPVLEVAQISREGEKSGPWTPPKASTISQSDFIGMDADVIHTFKRTRDGGRVMVHTTAKMRDAPDVRWYTRFEPRDGLFTEIGSDEAHEIDMLDAAERGTD